MKIKPWMKWVGGGVLCVVLAAGGALLWLLSVMPLSAGYTVEVQCEHMPENDEHVVEWLKNYPGVVESSVWIERDKQSVYINFIQSGPYLGRPPIPPLSQKFQELGYGKVRVSDSDHWSGK